MYFKRMTVCGLLLAAAFGWGISLPAAAQTLSGAADAPAVFFPEKTFEFAPVIRTPWLLPPSAPRPVPLSVTVAPPVESILAPPSMRMPS